MAGKCLIVEDEVLQSAAFDGHHHSPMRRGNGRDDSLTSWLQPDGLLVAHPGAPPATMPIASTGHTSAHFMQPEHFSSAMAGRKLVVLMGFSTAKRLAASMASQQHPQQLQMKATRSRTFSPNCTRLRSRACASRS